MTRTFTFVAAILVVVSSAAHAQQVPPMSQVPQTNLSTTTVSPAHTANGVVLKANPIKRMFGSRQTKSVAPPNGGWQAQQADPLQAGRGRKPVWNPTSQQQSNQGAMSVLNP